MGQGSFILVALLTGAILSGWLHVKSTDEEKTGQVLELAGPTLDGGHFDLEKERGKVVLLDFWASWCGPCIAAHPQLQSIAELYRDQDFEIIGVALDAERQALTDFLEAHSQPAWRQVYFGEGKGFDAPALEDLGVTRLPNYFLIDRKGRLKARPRAVWQIETLVGRELGAPVPWRDQARLFGARLALLLQTGLSFGPLWLLALGVAASSTLFALGLRVLIRPSPRTATSRFP